MRLLERELLLEQANAAARQAGEGQGSILLVSGEAGVGKTALIEALAEDQRGRGLPVFAGGCEALSSPRPLGPLRDIADAWLPPLRQLFERNAAAPDLFAALFDALAAPRSASLLVVEDLHWADEATLDLLKFLARRIAQLPLLLVLSFRDDELDGEHPLRQLLGDLPATRLRRLALAPLSAGGVAELCAGSGRDAAGLHRITGGNPFFLSELLASGVVDERQGVPSTVREAVQTRLQRLSAAQRELLQLLSLIPGSCPAPLAEALRPAGVETADIDACIQKGMLVQRGDELAFRHELARRAVADGLQTMQRRAGHAAILEQLLQPPAGVAAPSLATLAHHAAAAGDGPRLLEFAPAAAREAAAGGAHSQAALLLGAALQQAALAPAALRAELHETWSYEAGLALGIDAQVIAARHQAIALWRAIGRGDKVGLNLRWLSRLHWYQGEAGLAERYAVEAVAALEAVDAPLAQAWACSTRAQLGLLRERPAEAAQWGRRAIELATPNGHADVLSHALNIVGTAGLQSGDADAQAQLQRSLALALQGGFHEQAARSYATLAGHAVMSKDFAGAQRWLDEAVAFAERYKLDGRLAFLLGWQAQLRFEQGRWAEADRLCAEIGRRPRLPVLARLPAQTVQARLQLRRGEPTGMAALRAALLLAQPGSELVRLLPLRLAEAEACWLAGDAPAALAALQALPSAVAALAQHPWVGGELAVWRQRCGDAAARPGRQFASPWSLELSGDVEAAAQAWQELGSPYEAAMALLAGARLESRPALLARAAELLLPLGAEAALRLLRRLARGSGLALPRRRGLPRSSTRADPHGLTAREQQVLALIAEGAGNASIGAQLALAPRTVEHHVSAVLARLGVRGRAEAVALAWRERLLER